MRDLQDLQPASPDLPQLRWRGTAVPFSHHDSGELGWWLKAPSMHDLSRLSVLVVDDFAPMLTIVMKLLAQLDIHDVDCSMSVMGALDSVARRDYDLLILDYFL